MTIQKQDFYHISLKLLLYNSKNHILALKARNDIKFAGYYDVPGGRIDEDEFTTPLEDILQREVKEEIGDAQVHVDLNPVAVSRGFYSPVGGKDIRIFYVFFKADYKGGDILISDEHTDHTWLNLEEIDPKEYFTAGILEGIEMYLKSA